MDTALGMNEGIIMGLKKDLVITIVDSTREIVNAINHLSSVINQLKSPLHTVVEYNRVVWLDATGEYVLIWYGDGIGQILHVEGRVETLSTVAQHGKTVYKCTNGKEFIFDKDTIRTTNTVKQ